MSPTVTASSPADVARRGLEAALVAADDAGAPVVRLGVDGAVPGDRVLVADAAERAAADLGRAVLRVSAENYLRPRSVRLEHGPQDADSGYESWYDHLGLLREVLDPLAPGGSGLYLPALWDADRDRATRAPRREAPAGAVLVLDGPFLLRWEMSGAFDAVVHLTASPAALARRLPAEDVARVGGAWERYVEETGPAERADVLVRAEDPRRPGVVLG